MELLTKESLADLQCNGLIVGVPKEKNGKTELVFISECSYYSNGKHGLKTGYNPDNSSFYNLYYNSDSLPNGLEFNSTTRLPLSEEYLSFDTYNYVKFKNMEEFCVWYLQNMPNYIPMDALTYQCAERITPHEISVDKINHKEKHVCKCHSKQTRRQRLEETLACVNYMICLHDLQDTNKEKYNEVFNKFNEWLDKDAN